MANGFPPPRSYQPFWRRKYSPWIDQSSYSGCDIIPVVYGIDPSDNEPALFALGDIQTLTYSVHRDKGAVRTLGRRKAKGFVGGHRTIAGSMIFTVFDRRALWELSKNVNEESKRVSIADELPGFDIILYFTNEYGNESTLVIYNVQVADEGQSHSTEDMYIENTMSYVAQDIDLLEPKSVQLSSTAEFIADKRKTLVERAYGPTGLPFNYKYVKVPQST